MGEDDFIQVTLIDNSVRNHPTDYVSDIAASGVLTIRRLGQSGTVAAFGRNAWVALESVKPVRAADANGSET